MKLRSKILIILVVVAVLFSALVLYIRELAGGAGGLAGNANRTRLGPVSLQAFVNGVGVLTYNNTRNLSIYALLSYSLVNATNMTVSVSTYLKDPIQKMYIVNVSDYCVSCFNEDGLRLGLLSYLNDSDLIKNSSSLSYVAISSMGSIPGGSIVIIPSGLLPLQLLNSSSESSIFRMLEKGDTIIYAGANFSRAIGSDGLIIVNPPSMISRFSSYGISTSPPSNFTPLLQENLGLKFKGFTFIFPSGSRYGNITYVDSRNGTVIAFPNYPNQAWGNVTSMASDIAKTIGSRFWIKRIASGTNRINTVAVTTGNLGVFANITGISDRALVRDIINSSHSLITVVARNSNHSATRELAFGSSYAEKGVVSIQSVVGEGQSVPIFVSVNNRTEASIPLHIDIYNRNMSYVGDIRVGFVSADFGVETYHTFAFPGGYYILALKDFSNNYYSQTLFYLANATITQSVLDFKNGTFEFGVYSNGLPVSNADYRINLNGVYNSSGTVSNGRLVYKLPMGTIINYGTQNFNIKIFNTDYTIPVPYEKRILQIQPIYIEFGIAIIVVLLLNLVLKPPMRDEYFIDVPEFPPSKKEKVNVQAGSLMSVFDKVNYQYHWKYMPLTAEEVRLGINNNIRVNNMPLSITTENAKVVLARLVADNYLASTSDYYAPKSWVNTSKHSIEYLVMFRKLRDHCVSHAILFTDLDSDETADMLVTKEGKQSSVFVYSTGSRSKKIELTKDSKMFVVFLNDDTKREFVDRLYTSVGDDAETLKLGISYNYVRLIDCDHLDQLTL